MFSHRHITKDGNVLLIGQMSTDHLLKTVRLALRKMYAYKKNNSNFVDPYNAKLYGINRIKPEEVAAIINSGIGRLAPYFTEIILRYSLIGQKDSIAEYPGLMDEICILLQDIAGRNGKKLPFSTETLAQLSDGDLDDFDDDYDVDDYVDDFDDSHPGHPNNFGDN